MSKKYLSTGYLKSKPGKVNRENGIIYDVKVCTEGEALGHGYFLDSEFIENVTALGNERKMGLKARFGHPAMCNSALGTLLGRFKNFSSKTTIRDDGKKAYTAIADLHLSKVSQKSPNGNLYEYVLDMAEDESDMFGTSIVFQYGQPYRKDESGKKYYSDDIVPNGIELTEETFASISELLACDCVDDPAANDGMFSSFSADSVAGQISEFLDLNPEVFKTLSENKEVIHALSKHGDKIEEFFENYKSYKQQRETKQMSKEKPAEPVEVSKEKLQAENESLKSQNAELSAENEKLKAEKPKEEKLKEKPADNMALLSQLKDEFGAEIACDAVGKDDPYKFAAKKLKEQNAELSSEIDGLNEKVAELLSGADPVTPAKKPKEKKLLF